MKRGCRQGRASTAGCPSAAANACDVAYSSDQALQGQGSHEAYLVRLVVPVRLLVGGNRASANDGL
jgi:hypothetical protein